VVLYVAGRLHTPNFTFSLFGRVGLDAIALKAVLATVVLGLAVLQVLLALWIYRKLGQLLQVLAGRRTICRRHPHRYHVGQVDDHAILVGLAVISRMRQDQAAPFVQRLSDGLKRLGLPAEVLRYHGDVFTAHRVKSDDQHDVVGHSWYLPARTRKTARPNAVAWELLIRRVTADPDALKCASPVAGKAGRIMSRTRRSPS
jgi:hypothetical protein